MSSTAATSSSTTKFTEWANCAAAGITSTSLVGQGAQLVVIGLLLIPVALRVSSAPSIAFPALVGAPMFLGIFLGLLNGQLDRTELVHAHLASFSIYALLLAGFSIEITRDSSVLVLAFSIAGIAIALTAACIAFTVAASRGRQLAHDSVDLQAVFVCSSFFVIQAVTFAAVFWIEYIRSNSVLSSASALVGSSLLGRPESIFLALPAVAVATIIYSGSSEKPFNPRVSAALISIFGIVCLLGYVNIAFIPRYAGTPFILPVLALFVTWKLSAMKLNKAVPMLPLVVVMIAEVVIIISLFNRAVNSTWTFGQFSGSFVSACALSAIAGILYVMKTRLDWYSIDAIAVAAVAIIAVGGSAMARQGFDRISVFVTGRYIPSLEITNAMDRGYSAFVAGLALFAIYLLNIRKKVSE